MKWKANITTQVRKHYVQDSTLRDSLQTMR